MATYASDNYVVSRVGWTEKNECAHVRHFNTPQLHTAHRVSRAAQHIPPFLKLVRAMQRADAGGGPDADPHVLRPI